MRNIIHIDCNDANQTGILNTGNVNEIVLIIKPLTSQLNNFRITETGDVAHSSDFLTLDDSGFIEFTLPFNWYATSGTVQMRLEADEGNSEYITIVILTNLNESDDVIVKQSNDVFTINKRAESGGDFSGDYVDLENKPKINSVTLIGNKSGKQLSLIDSDDLIQEYEIDQIVFGGIG